MALIREIVKALLFVAVAVLVTLAASLVLRGF